MTEKEVLKQRTHVYLSQPIDFEISSCGCGNINTQWSEYERHVWCDKCEKDFIPEHGGVFDGPIPVKISHMLGLNFHRLNLLTNQVEAFTTEGYYVKAINFFSDKNLDDKKEITLKYMEKLVPVFIDINTGEVECKKQIKNGTYQFIIYTVSVHKEIEEWKLQLQVNNEQLKIIDSNNKDDKPFEIFKKFLLNQKLYIKYPELEKTKPRKI